jgi:hypothetical protein
MRSAVSLMKLIHMSFSLKMQESASLYEIAVEVMEGDLDESPILNTYTSNLLQIWHNVPSC